MEFIWNDGGRAACGFVGLTGDCVTRSIAIATGLVYRDVYRALSEASEKTARHGISDSVAADFLRSQGWENIPTEEFAENYSAEELPRRAVIVLFESESRRGSGHMCCVIDHTVYDTWNPVEDPAYQIVGYWVNGSVANDSTSPIVAPSQRRVTEPGDLSQGEFDRILTRVKALHRTASNGASTEGEIRNAMRMMQCLMLKHNLNRGDISEDDDASNIGMTRRACPLNGRRCSRWESSLAHYMTEEIFPMVQYYRDRHGHRTLFWFYGPADDVQQTIELFREILMTIATMARLNYGGYTRGSGASYAEGYVQALPRGHHDPSDDETILSQHALIHARSVAIRAEATKWLDIECDIRLHSSRRTGRNSFDRSAHHAGQTDGAKHDVSGPRGRARITHQS